MAKSKQDELIKFDARMIEYNLARGVITKEEYDKYLASLPDLSSSSAPFTIDDERGRSSNDDSH